MEVAGLTRKEDIVEVAAKFYPEARISGKLRLALDNLWHTYEASLTRHEHESPRYLGRSHDARKE
jgi:hypothetical protein